MFFAHSADDQTHNYETRVLKPPSLPIATTVIVIEWCTQGGTDMAKFSWTWTYNRRRVLL